MNYVKHLSIALLVLCAAPAVLAAGDPANVLASAGGTHFYDALNPVDGKAWPAHATIADTAVVTLADGTLLDVPDDVIKYDAAKHEKALINVSPTLGRKLREFGDKYWTQQSTLVKGGIVAAGLAGAYALYANNDTVKENVNGAIDSASDFVADVKDNKGNARRNAAILATSAAAAGALYYYWDDAKTYRPLSWIAG